MPLCFNFTQHSSQLFFPLSIQEGLVAIFEGVCERVVGSTFALQSYPEYLDFFRRCAVPDFSMPPLTRGPVLAHLLKLALPPFHLGQCPLCPLLIPWGRALGVHTRYGRLSNAPPASGPPPLALQGPVHLSWSVPPTAYTCGGFWLFTSGGARTPRQDGGSLPWRSLDSPSSPLGQPVLVGDAWALPLPVPA